MPIDIKDISKLGEGITLKDLPTLEAYTIEYAPIAQFAGVEKSFYTVTKTSKVEVPMLSFVSMDVDGQVKTFAVGDIPFGFVDKDPIGMEPVRDREGNLIYLMVDADDKVRLATVDEIKSGSAQVLMRGKLTYGIGVPFAVCVHGVISVPASGEIPAGANLTVEADGKRVKVAGETDVVVGKALNHALIGEKVSFILG
jgi:hypothetical protein